MFSICYFSRNIIRASQVTTHTVILESGPHSTLLSALNLQIDKRRETVECLVWSTGINYFMTEIGTFKLLVYYENININLKNMSNVVKILTQITRACRCSLQVKIHCTYSSLCCSLSCKCMP